MNDTAEKIGIRYITTRYWMKKMLGLEGSALLVYATIFSLSQGENVCVATNNSIAEHWGVSKRTVQRARADLEAKGLVERAGDGWRSAPLPFELSDENETPSEIGFEFEAGKRESRIVSDDNPAETPEFHEPKVEMTSFPDDDLPGRQPVTCDTVSWGHDTVSRGHDIMSRGDDTVSPVNKYNKNKININQSNESAAEDAAAFRLPLSDGSGHAVSNEDVGRWKELYPDVDVEQELRKMIGWFEGNPKKRKTKSGIRRFITGWLAREQDRGNGAPSSFERAAESFSASSAASRCSPASHSRFGFGFAEKGRLKNPDPESIYGGRASYDLEKYERLGLEIGRRSGG